MILRLILRKLKTMNNRLVALEWAGRKGIMKKIILRDASTCCANCFEMLDPDIEVYVDNDNDVICKECAEQ